MGQKVELNYKEGDAYPWRVEEQNTGKCVQRGGESLAYEHEDDAISAMFEFKLDLVTVTGEAVRHSRHDKMYFADKMCELGKLYYEEEKKALTPIPLSELSHEMERKEIWKIFEDIKGLAEGYLCRTYPDAPDPDDYMDKIEAEVKRYRELTKVETHDRGTETK